MTKKPKWLNLLKSDPREDLLNCDEPFTRYKTLIDLLEIDKKDKNVLKAKTLIKKDSRIINLVNKIADWEKYIVTGHQKWDYPPSLINLLFDMGVEAKDFEHIDTQLKKMLKHQNENGRFESHFKMMYGKSKAKEAIWGTSLCDSHSILLVLIRGGYKDTPEVKKCIERLKEDYKDTSLGKAWKCESHIPSKWRGPGRKDDPCPMVTLEALKIFSYLSKKERPEDLKEALNTMLGIWNKRKEVTPYMMGHGRRFRKFKAPLFWYNIGWYMDTLSYYPEIFDENAYIELLAILAGVNSNEDGKVVLKSIYRNFADFSFGQKKLWSPWQTYYLSSILKRSEKIVDKAIKVNIDYFLKNQ